MKVSTLLLLLAVVSGNTVTAEIKPENMSADIVLIADGSRSYGRNNFHSLLKFIDIFIDSLRPYTNLYAAVVQYSNVAREEISLMPVYNIRSSYISSISYIGSRSNTPDGLITAYSILAASNRNVAKKCILFSDGITNMNTAELTNAVIYLKTVCELIFVKVGYDGSTSYDAIGPLADSYIIEPGSAVDLSQQTITQLQEAISIAEGDSCTEGSPDEVTTCGVFICEEIDGAFVWNMYFTGCPFDSSCIAIGASATLSANCEQFLCTGIDCNAGLCDDIDLIPIDLGCTFQGDCKFLVDGLYFKPHPDCDLAICDNGVEMILQDGCPTENGVCVADSQVEDASVANSCVEQICISGALTPQRYGCVYMGSCIFPGDPPIEDSPCEFTTCEIIQVIPTITQLITDTQCNDGGTCHPVGSNWDSGMPCVDNSCVQSGDLVLTVSVITGCQTIPGPCTGVGEEFEARPCVSFTCNDQGDLILEESGCDFQGQCYPPGITNGFCRNFTCTVDTSVPNQVTQNLSISEGCIINGTCLLQGEVVWDGCLEITCLGHSSVSTEHHCQINGLCIPIGSTVGGICVIYTCEEDLSFSSEATGCLIEGECYEEGEDIPSDGCSLSRCELRNGSYERRYLNCRSQFDSTECIPDSGSDWFTDVTQCGLYSCIADDTPFGTVNAITYGCIHEDQCYMPNDTIAGCPPLICFGSQTEPGGLTDDPIYCVTTYGCFEIGEDWFDPDNCIHYFCISQDSGQTASVQETATGCQSSSGSCKNDSTVFNGTLYQRCSTFQCEDGEITALNLACYDYFSYSCLSLGEVSRDNDNCVKRTCTQTSANSANLIVENGCKLGEDCIYPGEPLTVDCRTYGCLPGDLIPDLISIDGCYIEKDKECTQIRHRWFVDATCTRSVCLPNGDIHSEVQGCPDPNDGGACVPIDGVMDPGDEECVIITCTGDPPSPSKVYSGCWFDGMCYPFGEEWRVSCFNVTCIGDPSAPGQLYKAVIGCVSDGVCYEFGETKPEEDNECIEYKCRTSSTWEVAKAECVDADDNSCHADGSSWLSISECGINTCSRESVPNSYRVNMIVTFTEGCYDPYLGCAQNQGSAKRNCTSYICESPDFVVDRAGCWDGETCVEVGYTWRNRCTTYSCELSENGTVINEITKRCDKIKRKGNDIYRDNGCTKLRCNKDTGNLEFVYAGYYAVGRCITCGSNDTVTDPETCITYTCAEMETESGSVATSVSQSQGCMFEGNCYPVGSEINDKCTFKVCEAGTWVTTEIQCSDGKGNCIPPFSIVTGIEFCITHMCFSGDMTLTPIKFDCPVDDRRCLLFGHVLEDNVTCTRQECVASDQEQGAEIVTTTLSGCTTANACTDTWRTTINMCHYRDCRYGVEDLVKTGCVWRGQCKQIGEKWRHKCVFYKCVLIDSDGEYYRTLVRERHGCYDCRGKCHRPRKTFYHGCIKQRCLPGGRLVTLTTGCWDSLTKRCVSQGTEITPYNKNRRQCYGNGYDTSPLDSFCVDASGKEIPINVHYENKQFCVRYMCMARYGRVELVEVSRGCSYKGACLDVGVKIRDYNTCRLVKCKAGRYEHRRLVIRKGCRKCGKCHMIGKKFDCNCKIYKCKADGPVLLVRACKWMHHCYRPGQTWIGKYRKNCYEYTCVPKEDGNYGKRQKKRICKDANGSCRRVGSAYYPCFLYQPKKSYGFCACKEHDGYPRNEPCVNSYLETSKSLLEYCKYYGGQGYVKPLSYMDA